MVTIQRLLLYGVQREAGGLTVYEAVEDAVDILPNAAGALAAGRDLTFIRAEMAMDSFAADIFVIEGFFHLQVIHKVADV